MSALAVLTRDSFAPQQAGFALSAETAVVVMEDETARILDMADRFYSISRIGALMLRHTVADGIDTAAKRIADEFGIGLDRAREDVERFIGDLVARGVLLRANASPRKARVAGLFAALFALLMKAVVCCVPTRRLKASALLTLARVSCRLCGWTATVAAWKRRLKPRRCEASADAHVAEQIGDDIEQTVARAAARHLLSMDCKERSLTCWSLARSAGQSPKLVIGAEFFPLAGHVWCEIDARIVSDNPGNCTRYLRVLEY